MALDQCGSSVSRSSMTIEAGTITKGFRSPAPLGAAGRVGCWGATKVLLGWGRDMDRDLLSEQRKHVARGAPERAPRVFAVLRGARDKKCTARCAGCVRVLALRRVTGDAVTPILPRTFRGVTRR